MPALTLADRLILFAANLFVWLRHPWLSLSFWYRRRRAPLLATPRGVSELVQWRKIFDRNPMFPVLADKLKVKEWARQQLSELRAAEVLWTGTRAAGLPDEFLRPDVVIKTNHGTSTNYFPPVAVCLGPNSMLCWTAGCGAGSIQSSSGRTG